MKYLEKYRNKLIEIYYDKDFSCFEVGYIINEDNKNIMLKSINPQGIYDDNSIINKESIDQININTNYLLKLKKLMKINSKENILDSYILNFEKLNFNFNDKLMMNLLKFSKDNDIEIKLTLIDNNTNILSKVKEIYKDFVELNNGTLIKISDIAQVDMNTLEIRENNI